jgi:hypothetical protein
VVGNQKRRVVIGGAENARLLHVYISAVIMIQSKMDFITFTQTEWIRVERSSNLWYL